MIAIFQDFFYHNFNVRTYLHANKIVKKCQKFERHRSRIGHVNIERTYNVANMKMRNFRVSSLYCPPRTISLL